jgi:hypothetical protein
MPEYKLSPSERLARARLAQKASKAWAAMETAAQGTEIAMLRKVRTWADTYAGRKEGDKYIAGIGDSRMIDIIRGRSPLTKDDLELLLEALNAEHDARKVGAK